MREIAPVPPCQHKVTRCNDEFNVIPKEYNYETRAFDRIPFDGPDCSCS